jgi:hypothetical protein
MPGLRRHWDAPTLDTRLTVDKSHFTHPTREDECTRLTVYADLVCGRAKGISFPYSSRGIHLSGFFLKLAGIWNSIIFAIDHLTSNSENEAQKPSLERKSSDQFSRSFDCGRFAGLRLSKNLNSTQNADKRRMKSAHLRYRLISSVILRSGGELFEHC